MNMADPSYALNPSIQPPPPPPPPPGRAGGVFQKFIAPLSFNIGARPHGPQATQSVGVSPSTTTNRVFRNLSSQTVAHRTGIPIAAIDINRAKTHAILAGQEILKTVHVQHGRMVEDFNLRSGINSYASAYAARAETINNRREYLPTKDVAWSKSDRYETIIAAAALNGRIALYDVSRLNSSRIELSWIHEHSGQVNKLDFDPTGGYLLLSGSQDRTVKVWDIREPQSVKRKQTINIRQPVRDVRWSPTDVGEFALCTENGVVQRWDLRMTSSALLSINAHEKACYAIDWHPDGRHLVSGGFDKYAKVWDFKSDNRRQKPAFSLRAPQAIYQIRWRPPCWSSNLAEKGHWQSAQLATSYTEDDPRIHVWDLRRPLLPFRELDKYPTRPTDMLWASKDYLWSVGNQGIFAQTDIRYASLVHGELSTSAAEFMPDGSFVAFSESGRARHESISDDPASGFLRVPQEKLSGGTDGVISRSISDDEEGEDGFLTTSTRRRISKSSRTAKSQGNTPPTGDAFPQIIPLDRAILNRAALFNNEQSGVISSVTGLSVDPEIVKFLAENYARPMTLEERKRSPEQILDRLREAFARNARVCDYVSMHRMAQTWRILSSVIVPEMQDWANSNRKDRLHAEARRKESSNAKALSADLTANSTNPSLIRAKVMNNLFRGVTGSEKMVSEVESTSNMTTPMARPLSDLPSTTQRRNSNTFLTPNEAIENIPPLPPSVVTSHSTAAAASRALLNSDKSVTPPSSPDKAHKPAKPSLHRRAVTDVSLPLLDRSTQLQSPKAQPVSKQVSEPLVQPSPRMELRKQEDRRAAIRDFRVQQRQLFTLEDPIHSPRYGMAERHDSSESFTMFSASTDSSQRARSMGQSFDATKDKQHDHRDSVGNVISTPLSDASENSHQGRNLVRQDSDDDNMQEHFPMDETSRVDFGLENGPVVKRKTSPPRASASASMWDIAELEASDALSRSDTAASSVSGGPFPLEEAANTKHVKIYTSNPIRRMASKCESANLDSFDVLHQLQGEEDVGSRQYIHSDFRPIDLTLYEPKLPFAWSAFPLLCHSIAFDVCEGPACAQFSVHLLMHVYPYFFKPTAQIRIQPGVAYPDSISERLMRPDLRNRIIEGLFLNHCLYLKKMRLYEAMSELKNVCADFGLKEISKPDGADQPIGASLKHDEFHVQASCSYCHSFLHSGTIVCTNCGHLRSSCPVCLQLSSPGGSEDSHQDYHCLGLSHLWTFCQACGHSAHWTCMQEWMLQPGTEGECPTLGCGCDCGPGVTRRQRIARQVADAETTDMIRGGRASAPTKKDPVRASHSPAVDKTRDALRNSEITRDSSGDEKSRRSASGRGRAGSSLGSGTSRASQSMGRRVRLVTPGESENP